MLEIALAAVVPSLVMALTSKLKTAEGVVQSANRITIVRGLVALLSLGGALLTVSIGEGELDANLVETSVLAIVNGCVATWIYFRTK